MEQIRRGAGPLTVERVEMLVDGQPAVRCRTGDQVVMRLHYRSPEEVAQPVFSVRVSSLGGAVVTAPATRDVGAVPPRLVGSGTLDVRFPSLPLLPGRYVVHTEATGFGRQHVFDHLQNAMAFDVMHGTSNETEGLITLDPLVTEVVPLAEWERAFAATRGGEGMKIVLDPRQA